MTRRRSSPTSTRSIPDRITNETNGITFRRWLMQANPGSLSSLIDSGLGRRCARQSCRSWSSCADHARRRGVPGAFRDVKRAEQGARSRTVIASTRRHQVDPDALFDVQVKRIHEYKRQLLNVLR